MNGTSANETEETMSDLCPDFAWLCEKLAQQMVDKSRDTNLSDGVTKFFSKGKQLDFSWSEFFSQ